MRFTVYKTTNKVNGKFYVGHHATEDPDDEYLGSGRLLRKAVRKYGRTAFVKEVLYDFDTAEEMWSREREIVDESFLARDDTYNLAPGGKSPLSGMSKKSLRILSRKGHEAQRRMVAEDPVFRARRLEIAREGGRRAHELGRSQTPSFAGQAHTEESKAKMREAMRVTSKGVRNSQHGTLWVRRGGRQKKVPASTLADWISDGWEPGRLKTQRPPSSRGKVWVCRGGHSSQMIPKADLPRYLESGWQRGRKVRG